MMMEWMVKIQPISPILGALMGLVLMKWKLKKQHIPSEEIMDAVTNAFLIIVVTWKFAPAILNLKWAIHSPWQALLTSGNVNHLILSCFFASGYVIWKSKKVHFSLYVLLDVLPFGIGSILMIYFLFHPYFGMQTTLPWGMRIYDSQYVYHPIHIYEIIIAAFLILWLWKQTYVVGSRKYMSYFLLIEGIFQLFISLISEQIPLLFGLSRQQLFAFVVMSVGILFIPKK